MKLSVGWVQFKSKAGELDGINKIDKISEKAGRGREKIGLMRLIRLGRDGGRPDFFKKSH
jgi:hypothetical protein